ncbi:glycerol kinase GlpK [Aeoliella sp.]|uniref:glycerol kinase GlpK n=1 Tax=Aeoliella sp. TaxID=2795800 RepID=UPI003CCB838A
MPHILAFDQGTTSSRAIVFDHAGNVVAIAQREFQQFYPKPGWVEHDAAEIWQSQLDVAVEAVGKAGLAPSDLAGIGITNQRETAIIWDRATGEPIHPAIVWQDRRTADTCDQLRLGGHEARITQRTGLVIDPYFSGTKFAWMLDQVPGARERASRGELAAGTVDSWLVYKLTSGAVHITDVTNAGRTQLMDIHRCEWDDQLLALLGVPRELLPEIRSSSEVYATVASDLPLADVPIAGIAGDQHAALFGQACFQPGMVKNTYGTGCFALMNTGTQVKPSEHKLLSTLAWQIGDTTEYALEGSIFVAGAVVQWLRDGLGIIKSAAEIEALATSVDDTGGVYFVPALAGLGAPHWDAYARGTIVGLTRGTSAAHIARAALEGIGYEVADIIAAMQSDSGLPLAELRVDGGASNNNLLMQMQADLLQAEVVRPAVTETTALGAAYLAGLATGVWSDRSELETQWQVDQRFGPQMSADQAAERRAQWNRAVERSREWALD